MTRDQKIEAAWIIPSVVIPAVMLVLLLYATFAVGIHVPGHTETIDPKLLDQTAPFNAPGVFERGPGRYDVVMIGQTWSFQPNEIRIPRGSTVNFITTGRDVMHGLRVEGTNVNIMLIPGEVGRVTANFPTPGEHFFFCHEFCGVTPVPEVGHQAMFGKLIVE